MEVSNDSQAASIVDKAQKPNQSDKQTPPSLNYRDAGVDIEAGNQLVEKIKPIAKKTHRAGVMSSLGGFGALFELPLDRYRKPILVSGTDGVGTKLKLAIDLGRHTTIGIDLVAMCVNDLIVQGAEPLFFLDYYATGKLDINVAAAVIEGIGVGCQMAGAALIGGETAEMPGMYNNNDYDLAGFCVGIVEKEDLIDGSKVGCGDVLIGIASSGPHSNGYSLIRKIIETSNSQLSDPFADSTLGDTLLAPTRIYIKPLLELIRHVKIHAMAHITGGGLTENLPRVMPKGTAAHINSQLWPRPPIFNWLQQQGNVSNEDMYLTFNCGIGMVLCIDPTAVEKTLKILHQQGETAWQIGTIEPHTDKSTTAVIIN